MIRRSSTREVQDLVSDLLSTEGDADPRREAAVARLRVIGDRAVRQVLTALEADTGPAARVALLRVLEGRREAAVAAAALRALASSDAATRAAAVLVARGRLNEADAPALLERLAALALDPGEARDVRLAAVAALVALPGSAAQPVLSRLATDEDPAIRLAASPRPGSEGDEPRTELEAAAAGELPADPQRLLDAVASDGRIAPLPTLHRLVTALRAREASERREARRLDWRAVRAAVHGILAARQSRVALYDARETLEGERGPLPAGFVDALAALGDTPCLEALAAAYAAAGDDHAWQRMLSHAAAAIAARERLTVRSAVVTRLSTRHGERVSGLLPDLPQGTRRRQ